MERDRHMSSPSSPRSAPALMAGLFFIFSVCIMTALGRLAPASGIAAMQSINVIILNGIFLTVFMGTALLCLALIAAWFLGWVPSGGTVRAGRQPALPRRHHRRDHVRQRADERRTRRRSTPKAAKVRRCGRTISSTGRCGTMSARCRDRRTGRVHHGFPRLNESRFRYLRDPRPGRGFVFDLSFTASIAGLRTKLVARQQRVSSR